MAIWHLHLSLSALETVQFRIVLVVHLIVVEVIILVFIVVVKLFIGLIVSGQDIIHARLSSASTSLLFHLLFSAKRRHRD